MEKKDFLPFCRYYKGEKENPFEGKDQNKAMLWFYERTWVFDTLKAYENNVDVFSDILDEYVNVGLGTFQQADGVPASLKAVLFNRYAKGGNSLQDEVEPFKKFYNKYYNR